MKVLVENITRGSAVTEENRITLPQGIIGFNNYTRGELLYMPEYLPFLWLKLEGGGEPVHFCVIEPAGIIADYELEIFDEDAESLELTKPEDVLILNIVTLKQNSPADATVNLMGPIVVNRRTHVGRQLVIANHSRFSAHHLLVSPTHEPLRASA